MNYQGSASNLPNDILRRLSQYSPRSYGSLARTSSRVRNILMEQQGLTRLCETPISPAAYLNYITSEYTFGIEHKIQHSYFLQSLIKGQNLLQEETVYIIANPANNTFIIDHGINIPGAPAAQSLIYERLKSVTRDELLQIIHYFFNKGVLPRLKNIYDILLTRGSCQQIANYALNTTYREFQRRLNNITSWFERSTNSNELYFLIERLEDLLEDMSRVLDNDGYFSCSIAKKIRAGNRTGSVKEYYNYLLTLVSEIERRYNDLIAR